MKDRNEYIDQLFEDALGNYSPEPSANSWAKIASAMPEAAPKKKYWPWVVIIIGVGIIASIINFRSCSNEIQSLSLPMTERISQQQYSYIQNIVRKRENIGEKQNQKFGTKENLAHNLIAKPNALSTKKESTNNLVKNSEDQMELANLDKSNSSNTQPNPKIITISEALPNLSFLRFAPKAINKNLTPPMVDQSISNLDSKPFLTMSPEIPTMLSIHLSAGMQQFEQSQPIYLSDNAQIKDVVYGKQNSLDLSAKIRYNRGIFYGETGLNYGKWGENHLFTIHTEKIDTSGGYISWNMNRYWTYDTVGFFDDPNAPGQTFPIVEATYHIDTLNSVWNSRSNVYIEKTLEESKNSYQYIEVPINLGMEINLNRFSMSAGAGIGIGYMIQSSGKYISNNELLIIDKSHSPYRKNNLNYAFQLGLHYRIIPQFGAFAQFSYKSQLTSIIKPSFDAGYKYSAVSYQFGIRYYLDKNY